MNIATKFIFIEPDLLFLYDKEGEEYHINISRLHDYYTNYEPNPFVIKTENGIEAILYDIFMPNEIIEDILMCWKLSH